MDTYSIPVIKVTDAPITSQRVPVPSLCCVVNTSHDMDTQHVPGPQQGTVICGCACPLDF